MRRALVAVMFLGMIACSDDTFIQLPTAPPPIVIPTLISGAWQGVVSSSTVAHAVWTMTLTQEQSVAFGQWTDDVNDYQGQANVTVTPDDQLIGTMSIRTVASCQSSVATCGACVDVALIRGAVSDGLMSWETAGWTNCKGVVPIQVTMRWRKQ